jgi:hypothetical protein
MIHEIDYKGYPALSLESDEIDVVIPTNIGPRVLRAGLKGQGNLFYNKPESMGMSGEDTFVLRGGHRLWAAPESRPNTYEPDNFPIDVEQLDGGKGLRLTGPVDERPGVMLQKELALELLGENTLRATNTLINRGESVVCTAPWALTVMNHGGYGVIPLPPKGSHPEDLLPSYTIIPWDYTDFSLPLWEFREGRIGLNTPQNSVPQKVGLSRFPGWYGYWQEAGSFVKYAEIDPAKSYPDLNAAFETFTNSVMLEMETLAPWVSLGPGDRSSHVEFWGVFENLPKPDEDAAYQERFKPAVEHWLTGLGLR